MKRSRRFGVIAEVIVEVPKGERNKYEVDHATGHVHLDRTLFTSMHYPADYGFVDNTLGEDGDPLDVLVMLDAPTFPGCRISVRPVAVFEMTDEHGPDAKLLVVPATDPRWDRVQDLPDVDPFLLGEISHFFEVYKLLEPGKGTVIEGWRDRATAEKELRDAYERAATHT